MTLYLLHLQKEQMWEEKKEEYKQNFVKSMKGLLHRKLKPKQKTAFDSFKKMTFSKNASPVHRFEGDCIWNTIQQCSRNGVDRLYDYLYNLYLDHSLPPNEWWCFENLIWNQGNELITELIKEQ